MNKKNGSITLMVIISMTIIIILIRMAMQINSYFLMLAHERIIYEKQYQIAYSLQSFCLISYQQKITKYITNKKDSEFVIFNKKWPDNQSDYKGIVTITNKKGIPILCTSIMSNQKIIITLFMNLFH